MVYRRVFIDPDFRSMPKTKLFCARCQKDIREDQPRRYIAYEFDTMSAVHPDDWDQILSERPGAFSVLPVGMDCAQKIGIDYTTP